MAVVGIKTKRELIAVASAYYAEANVSAKLFLEADALLAKDGGRAWRPVVLEPGPKMDQP